MKKSAALRRSMTIRKGAKTLKILPQARGMVKATVKVGAKLIEAVFSSVEEALKWGMEKIGIKSNPEQVKVIRAIRNGATNPGTGAFPNRNSAGGYEVRIYVEGASAPVDIRRGYRSKVEAERGASRIREQVRRQGGTHRVYVAKDSRKGMRAIRNPAAANPTANPRAVKTAGEKSYDAGYRAGFSESTKHPRTTRSSKHYSISKARKVAQTSVNILARDYPHLNEAERKDLWHHFQNVYRGGYLKGWADREMGRGRRN